MVRSSRFSGTMQAACGRCFSAMPTISAVAAISKLSGIVELAHQPVDVGIDDVAAILAQMGGDAVGAGRGGDRGGTQRIGQASAARVADGGDVIDVHAETQGLVRGHHVILSEAKDLIAVTSR